jgi:hypothetical protein
VHRLDRRLGQRIVGDEEPAVGGSADVEFDAVGTHPIGERERFGSVLRGADGGAAVAEYEHRTIMVEHAVRS